MKIAGRRIDLPALAAITQVDGRQQPLIPDFRLDVESARQAVARPEAWQGRKRCRKTQVVLTLAHHAQGQVKTVANPKQAGDGAAIARLRRLIAANDRRTGRAGIYPRQIASIVISEGHEPHRDLARHGNNIADDRCAAIRTAAMRGHTGLRHEVQRPGLQRGCVGDDPDIAAHRAFAVQCALGAFQNLDMIGVDDARIDRIRHRRLVDIDGRRAGPRYAADGNRAGIADGCRAVAVGQGQIGRLGGKTGKVGDIKLAQGLSRKGRDALWHLDQRLRTFARRHHDGDGIRRGCIRWFGYRSAGCRRQPGADHDCRKFHALPPTPGKASRIAASAARSRCAQSPPITA